MEDGRLKAMDAQRFDPSRQHTMQLVTNFDFPLKRNMGLVFSATTQDAQPNSVNDRVGGIWHDYDSVPVDLVSAGSSTLASSQSDTTTDSSLAFTFSSSDSSPVSSSLTLDEEQNSSDVQRIDVFDRDDFIITRTVIMPTPKTPLLAHLPFSRPTSPFSRPTSPFSRQASPFVNALNCFDTSNAFEEDVGFGQTERYKDFNGCGGIEVVVTQTHEQFREELWRRPLQQLMYGQQPQEEGIRSEVMACPV
ncbi:hypothetical protein SERLADRAFT_414435 [Serpula lacrymans var. lacrymans S7.9]|uniref:Uncharacterized protein n=1 Tax=Serpula lacrymans var. lacrymans (strain S7.9) TaxID=578457 RepID=F8NS06_SERL9|nr:uncharacterized protein SERLADRAFT_414435 [Serpula lacrymans var. lacrymans S7.9]EGO26368.1 hypothetical protein SERLADRAFT_414435 [Serpula lacrymans var. lacrymans S7.9]